MKISSDFSKKSKKLISQTTTGFLPGVVTVPLLQENEFECTSTVREGDIITEGQIIAEVNHEKYGARSFGVAKIHSPLPGKVIGIVNCPYPDGKHGKAVKIHLGGEFSHIGKKPSPFDWKSYSPSMLLRSISESGVINTFNPLSPRSLELDIASLRDKDHKKLVVRLFDEDPSCMADSTLCRCEFEKIRTGIFIAAKVSDCDEIIIAVDKRVKHGDFTEGTSLIPVTVVEIDTKNYPCGSTKQLVSAYKKQRKLTVTEKYVYERCLFTDAVTMLNVYNAAVLNIPVESVYVYVTGDCLQASGLLKVCIGTSVKDIAKQCGGFVKKPGKIIVNGLIGGTSISSLDTPVTKYVKSIVFTSKASNYDQSSSCCLHCGNCRAVCNAGLCPDMIFEHMTKGISIDPVFLEATSMCGECGICSIYCPSKLPLTQMIKILKGRQ